MSTSTNLSAAVTEARSRYDRGDLDGARSLLTQSLELATPMLGTADRDVLQTSRLLAALHRESGDVPGARRILEEAQANGQRQWPDEDPLMLLLAFDLGVVADEFGNRHEARRNLGLVARVGPGVFGPSHAVVLLAASYLDPESTQTIPKIQDSEPRPPYPPVNHRAPAGRGTRWIVLIIVAALLAAAATTAVIILR